MREMIDQGVTIFVEVGPGKCSPGCCGRSTGRSAASTWKMRRVLRLRSRKSRRRGRKRRKGSENGMFSLKDKVALVTGASQGIGRATALALAEAGAKVAAAARNAEKLASLVAEIEAAGGEALAVPMDVADAAQVKAGFQQTARKIRQARHSGEQRGDHARHAGAAHEARRLGRGAAHESDRRAPVHAAGAGRDAEAALGAHHQHDVGGGGNGQCGTGELRGVEGGPDRA